MRKTNKDRLDILLDYDKNYIDWIRVDHYVREESIFKQITSYLGNNGVEEEVAECYTLTALWYYSYCTNSFLYWNTNINVELIAKLKHRFSDAFNEIGITTFDFNKIRDIASIIHWKRMTSFSDKFPNDQLLKNLWQNILPCRTDLKNIPDNMESFRLDSFSNDFLLNIKQCNLSVDIDVLIYQAHRDHYLRYYCFGQLLGDDNLARLIYETLENLVPSIFNIEMDQIAYALDRMRIAVKKSNTADVCLPFTEVEDKTLYGLSDILNGTPVPIDRLHGTFMSDWESWRGYRNDLPNELYYLLGAIIFYVRGEATVYSYFENLLVNNEPCIAYLQNMKLFYRLYDLCSSDIQTSYTQQYYPDEKFIAPNSRLKVLGPRGIEQMVRELKCMDIKIALLPRPEHIYQEELNEINSRIARYCRLGQNFDYFFGYGELNESKGNCLEWSQDWNSLSYFLRILYIGTVCDGMIVFPEQKRMPKDIWSKAVTIFKDERGKGPKLDTLKKITLKEHKTKSYAGELERLLLPVLLKAHRIKR